MKLISLRNRSAPEQETVTPSSGAGLGTFGGVFTPSILTILGVIMYLRFGWVVGNVGLVGTLLIVTLSTSITLLTALSISSIATDKRVRVGGAYYMISRSLGIETGGAVGIPLYLAQALSVALYTLGFAESVVRVAPALNERMVAGVVTLLVAGLALKSAAIAIKAQYFIMAAIAISLLSFAFGHPLEATHVELWGAPPHLSQPFWDVFAVFFPAVTGIMAGVNMSGDLRNPSRSIPVGTIAAVLVGYLIYMGLPILLAGRADATTLISDPLIMRKMAFWGDAILLGVWGATLSSAMGSVLAAPRVLQAIARDGVLPRSLAVLGRGAGEDDTPRIGTVVTLTVALAGVALGDLNVVAPVLTMFFLATYLVLNLAAGIEGFLGSPSFRPSFRVHWILSLAGAVGCLGVMLLINTIATIVASASILAVYVWLERRELQSAWGDVRRGIWMALGRAALLRVGSEPEPKNWRPHILVLSGAPTRRWPLIELATSLSHSRGLVTVSTVVSGESWNAGRQARMERAIGDFLARRGVQALVRVIGAPDRYEGARRLVSSYGLGALSPNTVLLGASSRMEDRRRYCDTVASFQEAGRNVLILRDEGERGFCERERIDVWWGGLQANGGLMLICGYLLATSVPWRGAEMVVKLVVPNEVAAEAARTELDGVIRRLRIGARADVIVRRGREFGDIVRESSAGADLVFMGMARAESGAAFADYYEKVQERTRGLPPTVFALASGNVPFAQVLLEGA